ncbi:MAG: class I SAM-dependent RNA methyltransferase [Nitrospirae bacterium]|nr:class I SAM-dependent RNA methyltransferase [Nitrospirota bacterium]
MKPKRAAKAGTGRAAVFHSYDIEKIVPGGAGLARRGTETVFIPGTLPGEVVEARVVQRKKNVSFARVERIVSPSPDRIVPPCSEHPDCGGCPWMSFSPAAQIGAKEALLKEALARTGGLAGLTIEPAVPAPNPLGYRSRARLNVDRTRKEIRLGFHREGTNLVHPIRDCPVLVPALSRLVAPLTEALNAGGDRFSGLTEVHLQSGDASEPPLAALDLEWADPGAVKRLHQSLGRIGTPAHVVARVRKGRKRIVFGGETVHFRLGDLVLQAGDEAFTQSNPEMNVKLVEEVTHFVRGLRPEPECVFDLYTGIGNFALPVAKVLSQSRVFGVEENPAAVRDARANAEAAGMSGRVKFLEESAERGLELLEGAGGKPGLVILDPPRTGASREVIKRIVGFGAAAVLYISCDPVTLARDIKVLASEGYRALRIAPFDFFPQTPHLETLAVLRR